MRNKAIRLGATPVIGYIIYRIMVPKRTMKHIGNSIVPLIHGDGP